VVEDNEGSTNPNHPNGLAFPTAFESGDEAYVYWTAANQAAISVGEEPSDVAREFSFPSEDGDRGIYLAEIGLAPIVFGRDRPAGVIRTTARIGLRQLS